MKTKQKNEKTKNQAEEKPNPKTSSIFEKAKSLNHIDDSMFDSQVEIEAQRQVSQVFKENHGKPFKIMFALYKNHSKKLIGSTVFFIIKQSPDLFLPLIFAALLDIVAKPPADWQSQLIMFAVLTVILIVQNPITHLIHIKLYNSATYAVEARLRGAVVRKLQSLSLSFHKNTPVGAIHTKVMQDVDTVQQTMSSIFSTALTMVYNLVFSLSIILFSNIYVFLMFLVCVPIVVILRRLFRKKMGAAYHEMRLAREHTSSSVSDMLSLMPITRAHGLENHEIDYVNSRVKTMAKRGYKADFLTQVFAVLNFVTFTAIKMVVLFVSVLLAINGKISVGAVSLYFTYFGSVVAQVSTLLNIMPTFERGKESVLSIGEILESKEVELYTGTKKLKDIRGDFEFKNVHFAYDQRNPVLKGLNLKVNAGETVALVGESGAGKSTILNLVLGFDKIDSGDILIDGQSIFDIDLHTLRRHASIVPQESVLFSGSIKDNITYGHPKISKEKLNKVIEMAQLKSVIDSLPDGVNTKVGEHGAKLSGGQRQRISIARAIIRNPRIIIFDEATSALDTATEREIQKAIDTLSHGRTTFIV
ncbi:MAG: ABC transporter ATP-binding protein, partial [Oscillospiraceae bacterium]|nr:ABC transporter ATP-binding protein [Candidatus Equicaccousia limihippi]